MEFVVVFYIRFDFMAYKLLKQWFFAYFYGGCYNFCLTLRMNSNRIISGWSSKVCGNVCLNSNKMWGLHMFHVTVVEEKKFII